MGFSLVDFGGEMTSNNYQLSITNRAVCRCLCCCLCPHRRHKLLYMPLFVSSQTTHKLSSVGTLTMAGH